MGHAAAVVLAGGSGSRVGAAGNKVYLPVAGRPLLSWALAAFAAAPSVRRLVLVGRPADREEIDAAVAAAAVADAAVADAAVAGATVADAAVADAAVAGATVAGAGINGARMNGAGVEVEVVDGGATRHGSEWAALRHLAPAIRAGELDVVAIHDGARPLASRELIEATLDAARVHGAAVPGVALTDAGTIDPAHGLCTEPATRRLVRVQTPQAFRAAELLSAYEQADRDGFTGTDTAACVERYAGLRVHCLPGDPRNLKVTYRADLDLAARLLGQ